MAELRPYQETALQDIRATVGNGVRRLVVQAPTGAGKTLLAAAIAHGAQSKGNRLAFIVPAISLVDQTVQMFWDEDIRDVGVIQANHQLTDWSKPIQVCSVQTIASRQAYPKAKVVIIDECHQLHKAHIAWLNHEDWKAVPFIGLSATPWTRGLGRYFESLLIMSTTKQLIEQGYLSKFRVFASDHPDLSGVKDVAGDYHEGQLSRVMQGDKLVANIIETWKLRWNQNKTFVFGVDCAHAQMLQARFLDAGISCAYQDASTTLVMRADIKRKFHNGEYRVVCNVGTLTTGVDWDVRCLVLARPTKSEMLFVQIVGRALRTAEGKEHALIFDHTDTTSRLGFVTDIHHEQLNDGRLDVNKAVRRGPPLPKPCRVCSYLLAPGIKVCPECGTERKIESKIYEHEGELVEFDGNFRKKGTTSAKRFPYTVDEQRRFYQQLMGYQIERGYKPGWPFVKYMEKFNSKPPYNWNYLPPMAAGPEVRMWIRHTMMAWAKGKSGGAAWTTHQRLED